MKQENILSEGEAYGYTWFTRGNGMAFRCGYVQIPNGHPWYNKLYDDLEPYPNVHGGITYAEAGDDCWVLGFDCAHYRDLPDPELSGYRADSVAYREWDGEIRTQDYVDRECKKLCKQIHEATQL